MRWIIILGATLAVVLGLFLAAGGKLIALEHIDFPRDELEKLIIANPPEAELTLSGSLEVQVGSPWTRWAMKLLPGTFLVDVKINGRKASLVVDTGAAQTFISPQIAVAAQVILTSSRITVQHGWREVPVYMGRVRELELGNLRVHNLPIVVGGTQPVLKLLGLPIWNLDGVLGMEPLQRLALTLDYEREVVVLRRESPPSLGASSAPLQILREQGPGDLEHPKPMVDCFIGDSGPFSCFIDTGTSSPVLIPRDLWKAIGLEGQKQGRLKHLRLGELELKEVPVVRGNVKYITIGSNIFQSQGIRRLTLDFLAGKLYAER